MRLTIAAAIIFATVAAAAGANLTLACLDFGRAVEACRAGVARFEAETGHTVRVVTGEASGRTALERYQALLEVASARLDVIQFPEAWFPALADQLAPLELPGLEAALVPALRDSGVVAGQRLGVPHYLSILLLFVRGDVMATPPATWEALGRALGEASPEGPSGIVLAGEGTALFPFLLDWFYGFGVTSLLDRAGIEAALTAIDQSVGEVATPDVLDLDGRQALEAFTSGRSAALLQPSTHFPEVAASPVAAATRLGPRPAAADASPPTPILARVALLAISRHSRNPAAARELLDALVSREAQRFNAVEHFLSPTTSALYEEAAVVEASEVIGLTRDLLDALQRPPVEPYGKGYIELADAVATSVRAMVRGSIGADEAARDIVRAARQAAVRQR